MKKIVIKENDAGQKLNKLIVKLFPKIPKSLMHKLIRIKKIKINSKRCNSNSILNLGDVVEIHGIDDLFFKKEFKISNAKKLIDVVFENSNLMIVNKPAGIKSQPDYDGEDCMLKRIQTYLFLKKEFKPNEEIHFKPTLCNRLDFNTDGLIVAAKNFKTLQQINLLMREGKIKKTYRCEVHGNFNNLKNEIILTGWWSKSINQNKVLITKNERAGSKKVVTKFKIKSQSEKSAKLEISISNGKKHQIRAHLASIGHPIIGDLKYGSDVKTKLKLTSCGIKINNLKISI